MFWFPGNVAYNKTATHGPRTVSPHVANRAIDGNHDPRLGYNHCAYSDGGSSENTAWWQVDLGDTYVVFSVNITNRSVEKRKLCRWVF